MKIIKGFFIKLKSIIFRKKNIKWFALLLIFIVVFLFFNFNKKVKEYKVEHYSLYQYFSGFKMEYKGEIKLEKESNEITKISFGDEVVNLNSTPLYYKGKKRVLFPESMSVVKPKEGKQYRINYYSMVYHDLDSYSVREGNSNHVLNNAVIYDGKDLYFFVEDVNVSFGDNNISLGALSYIVVDTFNHSVEVYDYGNDKAEVYENVNEEVIIESDGYRLNATLDVMYYNNKSRLLFKDISKLKHLS